MDYHCGEIPPRVIEELLESSSPQREEESAGDYSRRCFGWLKGWHPELFGDSTKTARATLKMLYLAIALVGLALLGWFAYSYWGKSSEF